VVVREILPGIVTALLLAFGRGIGDAAAVLLVAGFQDGIPQSLLDPVATLPLAIFFQISSPLAEVQARGYASSLILMIIILLVSFVSRVLSRRSGKWRSER
jgi:phosphate transport system permease protein